LIVKSQQLGSGQFSCQLINCLVLQAQTNKNGLQINPESHDSWSETVHSRDIINCVNETSANSSKSFFETQRTAESFPISADKTCEEQLTQSYLDKAPGKLN